MCSICQSKATNNGQELNEFFERTPGATPDQIKAKILEIDELISEHLKQNLIIE